MKINLSQEIQKVLRSPKCHSSWSLTPDFRKSFKIKNYRCWHRLWHYRAWGADGFCFSVLHFRKKY